jgi:hypothetical protein
MVYQVTIVTMGNYTNDSCWIPNEREMLLAVAKCLGEY